MDSSKEEKWEMSGMSPSVIASGKMARSFRSVHYTRKYLTNQDFEAVEGPTIVGPCLNVEGLAVVNLLLITFWQLI